MIETKGRLRIGHVQSSDGTSWAELEIRDVSGALIAEIKFTDKQFREMLSSTSVEVDITCGQLEHVGKKMTHRTLTYSTRTGDHKYHDGTIPPWLEDTVRRAVKKNEQADTPRMNNRQQWVVIVRSYN